MSVADYVYILVKGAITFAGDAAEAVQEDIFSRYLGAEHLPADITVP